MEMQIEMLYTRELEKRRTKEEKLEYLRDCKFNIDMIDRWQEEDKISYDIVCKLIKEVEEC